MAGVPRPEKLRGLLCEGTDLDQYVQFSSEAETEAFRNVSCSLSTQQLIGAQQVLLRNLNPGKVFAQVSVPLLGHLTRGGRNRISARRRLKGFRASTSAR